MGLNKESELKELLDNQHNWPEVFMFKFIYENIDNTEQRLKAFFNKDSDFIIKSSTKQKFNSMTVNHLASSADEVLDLYKKVSEIKGVISL